MALSATRRFGWIGQDARVRSALRTMEVHDLASHRFAKLSGGQQQRILLAGALATAPHVLVFDEPTDGLDVRSRQALLDTLRAQTREGMCMVMISHDVEDILYLADQVAVLHPPDDSTHPSHVELIQPHDLGQRVVQARRAS
jgi:ABC-type Mn2+/Zn2+ transport system ATPase subunit